MTCLPPIIPNSRKILFQENIIFLDFDIIRGKNFEFFGKCSKYSMPRCSLRDISSSNVRHVTDVHKGVVPKLVSFSFRLL